MKHAKPLTAKAFKNMYMNKAERTRAEQIMDHRMTLADMSQGNTEAAFAARKARRALNKPVTRWDNQDPGSFHNEKNAKAVRDFKGTHLATRRNAVHLVTSL